MEHTVESPSSCLLLHAHFHFANHRQTQNLALVTTKSFHFCFQSQTNTKSSIIQSPTTSWLLQKSFYIAAGDPPVHRGWLLAEPRLAYFSALVSTCDARPKRAQHVFHHILACSRLWSDPAFYMHPPNAHACFASPYLLSAPQHLYLHLPLKPNQTCA